MFQLPAEDRLRSWCDFRLSLDLLPLDIAIAHTATFWASAPFTPYHLDDTDPGNWPNPWELISENIYCDVAKCLGIVYTMLLTSHRTKLDFELRVYVDPIKKYSYNLAWLSQGKYILNLIDGTVVNIKQFDESLELKFQYSAVDLQLENY